MTTHLQTPTFYLREIIEADAQGMLDLHSDPAVHTYLGNTIIRTMEEAHAIVQHVRKQYAENGIGRWAIIDKATGDFIGWSGLKYETQFRENIRYYDLGYRLRPKYWGKGIATQTAKAALHFGFEELGLKEIYAAAHTDNAASNKILTKLGFTFIETFEAYDAVHNWYKLDKTAWEQGNAAASIEIEGKPTKTS